MAKYGIGIHGAGWVAGAHIVAYKMDPRAEVVAISSRKETSARRLAQETDCPDASIYTSYDELLADARVDVISICTPNFLHSIETIKAAEAGKHILIEKPVALTLDELRASRDAVRQARVKTVVGFVLRWNPLFEIIKEQITEGALGRIFYSEVDYWHELAEWYAGWDWVRSRKTGGNTFLSAGCHAVDALRYFKEQDIVEVFAYEVDDGSEIEEPSTSVLICKFADGTIGKASSSLGINSPYQFNIDLLGEEGTIRDNRLYTRKMLGQTDYATIPTIMPNSGDVAHHPFNGEMAHLLDCVDRDEESHVNLDDAINTHEACIAAEISATEGRPVALPLLSD
ncbi:MAG: Gfo/Idh/MocA family oxidoreductase [Candidatus Hydrogenedentes bacterium]|nr:Gfo/Idh/MocA family oxidoreductase [Candidatus Hydrogenedentota bacterium]